MTTITQADIDAVNAFHSASLTALFSVGGSLNKAHTLLLEAFAAHREAAEARAREEGAKAMQIAAVNYIDGRNGVIPGATAFVPLIIGHNQPCMSGDMRDRLSPHKRRQFDDAARDLANAIAALDPAQIAGGGK